MSKKLKYEFWKERVTQGILVRVTSCSIAVCSKASLANYTSVGWVYTSPTKPYSQQTPQIILLYVRIRIFKPQIRIFKNCLDMENSQTDSTVLNKAIIFFSAFFLQLCTLASKNRNEVIKMRKKSKNLNFAKKKIIARRCRIQILF